MFLNNSTSSSREDYLKQKRKNRIIKYSLYFSFFLLLIGVFSYISHRKELRISKVVLLGGDLVKEEDVREKSLEFIKGSYIWLFPKDNSFWIPRKSLEEFLTDYFKRIDTVKVEKQDLHTILVKISERTPVAIWCNDENVDLENTQCYFIDQDSRIFAEAPYFSGDAYFKYYGAVSSSTSSVLGEYYISSSTQFREITDFIHDMKEVFIYPMSITAQGDNQFFVILGGGGRILFDLKEPLSKTIKNLESLLKTSVFEKEKEDFLNVDYIDLRFGNKLFYKLKNDK